MSLPKNIGQKDRNIRLAVAGVLILLGLMVTPVNLKIILTVVGLIVLVTGWLGFCPAYIPLKINTDKNA